VNSKELTNGVSQLGKDVSAIFYDDSCT
jgi:hypothetical protein